MKQIPKPDEFYVGYLPVMPPITRSFLTKVVVAMAFVVVLICGLVVLNQREFTTNNFEYGISTQLEGVVYKTPVPHLVINLGADQHGGRLFKTVLLVGQGKAGAARAIEHIENRLGQSIDGRQIVLNGYLIYGDGKTLFQIMDSKNINPVMSSNTMEAQSAMIDMGESSMSGEVIDPKCYFGVMKPGEGKAHRSCAIRCIAGGIPPLFHVSNSSEYYILMGQNFEPINQHVLGLVGDQIKLSGKVMLMNDWKVLVVSKNELADLAKAKTIERNLLAMGEGMTVCGDMNSGN